MNTVAVKPINVSLELHKEARLVAALEERQLREVLDRYCLPVLRKRRAKILGNGKSKQ